MLICLFFVYYPLTNQLLIVREWPAAYSHDTSSVRKLKKPVYTFPLLWFHPMTPQLLVSWQPAVAPLQCTSLINGRPLKFLWISLRCPNDLIFAGTRSPLACQPLMSAAPSSLTSAPSRWTFRLKIKNGKFNWIEIENLIDIYPIKVDFPCQPGKYRAYNGYCNNVQNPNWGVANRR